MKPANRSLGATLFVAFLLLLPAICLAAPTVFTLLAAESTANPRDAYAELYYGNHVGGATPFGATNNPAFAQYQQTLRDKGQNMFGSVDSDLQKLRDYRDSIPPVDFLGAAQRSQLNLAPTPAQSITGDGASPVTPPSPDSNPLAAMMDKLNGMSPQQQTDFRNYVTGGAAGATPQAYATGGRINVRGGNTGNITGTGGFGAGFAAGGQIDFGNATRFGGMQPSSSEGGTNMNIHEPAVLIGMHSGHHYATVAENGYPEQIKIIPTPAGKKAAMEAEKVGKTAKDAMGKAFGTGGSVYVTPSTDALNEQLSQFLNRLGGPGGGTGASGMPDPRMLAGAPWSALQGDRRNMAFAQAGYSAQGIDPMKLEDTVKQFTPQGITNNIPRVSWA